MYALAKLIDRMIGLLIESHAVVLSDPCKEGKFYRLGQHGLSQRIRECLKSAGVKIAEPANTQPASVVTQSNRAALSLVYPQPPGEHPSEDVLHNSCAAVPEER